MRVPTAKSHVVKPLKHGAISLIVLQGGVANKTVEADFPSVYLKGKLFCVSQGLMVHQGLLQSVPFAILHIYLEVIYDRLEYLHTSTK